MTAAGPDSEPQPSSSPLGRIFRRDRARIERAEAGDDARERASDEASPDARAGTGADHDGAGPGPDDVEAPTDRPLNSQEAVAYALDEWRATLVNLVGGSSLENIDVLGEAIIDLSSAHPSGLAQLLAGRPTRLSNLFREPDALPAARRSARAVVARTLDYAQRYGMAPTYLAIGVATWTGRPGSAPSTDDLSALARVATTPTPRLLIDPPPHRVAPSGAVADADAPDAQPADAATATADAATTAEPLAPELDAPELDAPELDATEPGAATAPTPPSANAPVLLRSLTIRPAGRGDSDFELTLEPTIEINTLLVHALRDHGALIDPIALAQGAFTRVGFDPSTVLSRIRKLGDAVLDGFTLTERTLVGSFVHPGQHLVDDLDELGPSLGRNELVAALAGAVDVQVPLGPEPPARHLGDIDPVLERGVGDLDAAQRHVVDTLVAGGSFAVDAPSGSDVVGTVAAMAAEAAASGRHVLYVAGHRRAADAVTARLGDLGLGELTFEIAPDPEWRSAAATRLLTAMASEPAPTDMRAHAETMDALVGARARIAAYISALHLPRSPWGVSAYDALQALARLTSERPAPGTNVRLTPEVVRDLDDDTRTALAGDLVHAASLGAFRPHAASNAWYGADLESVEQARDVLTRLDRLRTKTLPRLRGQITHVAEATSLVVPETLRGWADQLAMLGGMRSTLDVFQPVVFEQSAADMVQATAGKQWRADHGVEMTGRARRALVKRAKDLLRPGVRVDDLHAALTQVDTQRAVWARSCPSGRWPRLPEGLSAIEDTYEAVQIDTDVLAKAVASTTRGGELVDLPFDELDTRLTMLSDDRTELDDLPARTAALRRLRSAGLRDFVSDLARRAVDPGLVASELELAWWGSVFEQIVAGDPALTGQDGPGLDELASRFRDLDRRHVEALPTSVLNHVRAHLVEALRVDPDATQELFGELLEGRLRTIRDLEESHGDLVRALRPVVVATPTLVPQLYPATRTVDLVIIDAIQHVPLEMLLSALARARQVVVVGDVRSASGGAVRDLARVLPTVSLRPAATRRDAHLVGFLASHGYDGVLEPAPLPVSRATVFLHVAEGSGMPDPASGAVESTQAEVDRVVELAIEHAMLRPEQTLGVVAATPLHAARIRDALLAEVRQNPGLAAFFSGARPEPVVVADLTSVAGLTRDAIVLTLGYGKTPHGRVLHRFGQIGEAGGDALLLDAVGATRERLDMVACFRGDELDPERLRGPGPRLLADLLTFAAERDDVSDPLELWDGVDVGHGTDRLVLDLAERLWRAGLVVETDFGAGAHDRVPLVVGHPDLPDELLVAVLTDDAAYVGEPSVRVRERQRAERLEQVGWTVVQVWSAAAFLDPEKEAERIRRAVHAVRDARLGERTATGAGRPGEVERRTVRARVAAIEASSDESGSVPEPARDATAESVGAGDAEDGSVDGGSVAEPEGAPAAARRSSSARRRVVRRGSEREVVEGVTKDEERGGSEGDENDERLRRDVPPHWQ